MSSRDPCGCDESVALKAELERSRDVIVALTLYADKMREEPNMASDLHPINQHEEEPSMAKAEAKERAVLVTTEHRGVFFGYAKDTRGETVDLRAGRNCLYWSADVKGFLGLASMGPTARR